MENNKISNGKISVRQTVIMLFIISLSGITRFVPVIAVGYAKKAAWLTPVAAIIPVVILIYILQNIIKRNPRKSYAEIIEMVFGKVIGKLILSIFIIVILFLSASCVRNFAEKIVSSIFFDANIEFFILALLIVSYFVARRNIQSFMRLNELFFFFILLAFIVFIFLGMFEVDKSNLLPLSAYDILPVLNGSLPMISIAGMLSFILFLNDNISNISGFAKTSFNFWILLAVLSSMMLLIIIGVFGAPLTEHLYLPFYSTFRAMNIPGISNTIETFYIFLWMFIDFIFITFLMYLLKNISKTLFNLNNPKNIMTPFYFIIFTLSLFIAPNRFELDLIERDILNNTLIITGYGIPVLTLIVGKIRRVL